MYVCVCVCKVILEFLNIFVHYPVEHKLYLKTRMSYINLLRLCNIF